MEVENNTHLLCEERYGKVVSIKCGKEVERIARFLKPCVRDSSEAERIASRAQLLFEEFASREEGWPQKVSFKGWALPQKNWNVWVEKLAAKYCIVWKQTGICDVIMSSCYEIRCNKEIVLGLAEFWCPETNTFVFPWGEATITLEDVMILGGFSVLGESTKKPVSTRALEMAVDAMRERKTAFARERSKKATHSGWMKHFMENGSEFEHVAFLTHWLSRYVFPLHARETISKDVFSIAAHLSEGTQIALAPAVLAELYKNLRLLKQKALASSDDDEIAVLGPFQLVLLWAFEHLPRLVQKPPNILKPGEPRVARWHKVNFKIDKFAVNTICKSGESFQWRPYAADIENWNHSSYYQVKKHLFVDSKKISNKDLQCYALCQLVSLLVGLDCEERYMPHRVAMQFGMDQDLPGEFSNLVVDFVHENVYFCVPPRTFEPGVSLKYYYWWKNSNFICAVKLSNVLRKNSDTFQTLPAEGEMSSGDYHTPIVATRLKNDETISRSSTKYKAAEAQDDERKFNECKDGFNSSFESFRRSGFPTRKAESLRRSPSIEEVKGYGGDGCTSSESFASQGSPKGMTQCSAGVECHAPFSPIQRFQDSVEVDHVAVPGTFKQIAKDMKDIDGNPPSDSRHRASAMSRRATSDEVRHNKNLRKRKLSTSSEESSNCKATTSTINGNTDELRGEQSDEKILKITVEEERRVDTNRCAKATMDVSKDCKGSTAKLSANHATNTIDNNDILKTQTTFETFDPCDLEKRIQKLEKLLGISADILP